MLRIDDIHAFGVICRETVALFTDLWYNGAKKGGGKMNKEIIEKVRSQFIKASKEFHFTFVSPYPLDEDTNLYAFGFIDGYASKSGAIIDLVEPPHYEANQRVDKWCKEQNRWLSQINVEPLLGEYDHKYFKEMLDDWKI